jgi:L-alanine-DL-glutamate epimerase-like enolase superfamily enzyme
MRKTVDRTSVILAEVISESGIIGWGEGTAIPAVSGETPESIEAALRGPLSAVIMQREFTSIEDFSETINCAIAGNPGAKAALDIAAYDIFARELDVPLYRALGGAGLDIETGITIGLGDVAEMEALAVQRVKQGFTCLKLKAGRSARRDLEVARAVRSAVGPDINLRLDANQGWSAKEAVSVIRAMENEGLDIELIEQPVRADDIEGLRFVCSRVLTSIVADESVITPADALEICAKRAADVLNVKIQKNGGVGNVLRMVAVAEAAGMKCMIGCALETTVSITAAASIAAARSSVCFVDLDAPLWLANSPVVGGVTYSGPHIRFPEEAGLGISGVR